MRVLGIDPGYAIVGWAVTENNFTLVDFGTIETSSNSEIGQRLLFIHDKLVEIINQYHPEEASIEKLFFAQNTTTAFDVSKTIGVILLVLEKNGIKHTEYTPLQVKKAIAGYGRAEKKQMQLMIQKLYKLKEIPKPDDAADALAIATCHNLNYKMSRMLKK